MILDGGTKLYKALKNRKKPFVGDKLLLSCRSASSGLKGNALPCHLIQIVNLYNIIL